MALASICGWDELKFGQDSDLKISNDTNLSLFDPACAEFALPSTFEPLDFVKNHFGSGSRMEFLHGTTTLAFIYEAATPNDKGGIVVAADSRATSGQYIGSGSVTKILEVSDHIVSTMAGGAADCQFWIRLLAKQAKLFELQNQEKISVAAASKLLANMMYNYKGMGLSLGSQVAGFDKRGPCLYFVDNDGTRVPGKKFSIGSGSLNAYGILDTFWKPKMTDKDAIELGRKAIMHATYRDTGSGGSCLVYHITKDGQKNLGKKDVSDMYYDFMAESNKESFDPSKLL